MNIEAVPVRHGDMVVAVLTHQTAVADTPQASPLETAYLDCAADLVHMLSEGTVPDVGDLATSRSSPRAGDGFIRLNVDGVVSYASPNALSAFHRMGLTSELEGHDLIEVTRPLDLRPLRGPRTRRARSQLVGRWRQHAHRGRRRRCHGAAADVATGGQRLSRRRRHTGSRRHRSQTPRPRADVQGRYDPRNPSPGKEQPSDRCGVAALAGSSDHQRRGSRGLIESVRRVSSIALVHDALSMSVDEEVNLDEVIDRILPIMNDVATVDTPIRINRTGMLGVLDSDRATALVMVITELVQNAIEHAFDPAAGELAAGGGGSVTIRAERSARWLDVVVHDNGRGLPEGFSIEQSDRLGLQIVRTLVSAELDGSLDMHDAPEGGTDVVLRVPIGRRVRAMN